jgi:hypothetical protein
MEGDLAGQERLQREVLAEYDRIGDRIYSVFVLASFALTKSRRGDPDGALAMLTRGRAIGDPEDVADQIMLDLAEAHVRGRHGQQRRARASLESARRRLAGTRMNEVSDLVGMVGGELEMMAGHRDRAMQLTNPIAEAARDLGYPRYADAVVRTVRAAE